MLKPLIVRPKDASMSSVSPMLVAYWCFALLTVVFYTATVVMAAHTAMLSKTASTVSNPCDALVLVRFAEVQWIQVALGLFVCAFAVVSVCFTTLALTDEASKHHKSRSVVAANVDPGFVCLYAGVFSFLVSAYHTTFTDPPSGHMDLMFTVDGLHLAGMVTAIVAREIKRQLLSLNGNL